jgi:hypothetical protein
MARNERELSTPPTPTTNWSVEGKVCILRRRNAQPSDIGTFALARASRYPAAASSVATTAPIRISVRARAMPSVGAIWRKDEET